MKLSLSRDRRRSDSRSYGESLNLMTVGTMCRDERDAVAFDHNVPADVSRHRHVASSRMNGIATEHDIIVRNSPVSACQDVSLERIPTEPAHQANTPPWRVRRGDPEGSPNLESATCRQRESTCDSFVPSAMSACCAPADASTFAR